jgi:hypothetical protein
MGSASAWARFLIFFCANNTHRQVLLLCLHHHVNPIEQNLLLARDTTINLPAVVEVERTRDEGGWWLA